MKSRSPRFQRLKFREFDSGAREALRSMVTRMPIQATDPKPVGGPDEGCGVEGGLRGACGDEGWLLGRIGDLVGRLEPLGSPLAFYAIRLDAGELVLLRADVAEPLDSQAPPQWNERILGRVRRLGPALYSFGGLDGPGDVPVAGEGAPARQGEIPVQLEGEGT